MTDSVATGTVAVVVAYNRRDLLAEALRALRAQTRAVDAIVVVDNASTDGTSAMVAELDPAVHLVRLERNTGGAGGFAVGIQQAVGELDATWVWAMDDDTIPEPGAHAALLEAVEGLPIDMAGSRVVWTDGSDHPMNTPRQRPFATREHLAVAESAGGTAVRSSSFVSMFIRGDAVRRLGLPIVDYFIWNDDFEYSTRLLRHGHGVFVPQSVVVHKTKALGSTDHDPGERFYFEVRNKLWMLRRSASLSAGEKLVYGASTVRRWLRTWRRSHDRATLRSAFRRGWADGWRTVPQRNADALAGLGAVTEGVAELERAAVGTP